MMRSGRTWVWPSMKDRYQSDWEVNLFTSWTTFLLGFDLERHPHEWTLQLHLGPFSLHVLRVH